MNERTTIFVALDVHKESHVAAYSIGLGAVQSLGNIGTRQCDLDSLCKRMPSRVLFSRAPGAAAP